MTLRTPVTQMSPAAAAVYMPHATRARGFLAPSPSISPIQFLRATLCSGFMVIRATPRTAELFDPGRIFSSSGEEEGAQYREHFEDQMYLNEVLAPRLGRDRVTTLDRARFPNGAFYRVQQQKARRMSGEAPGQDGGNVAASSHNDSDAKRQTKTRNSAAQPTDIDLSTVRRPRDQHDGAAALYSLNIMASHGLHFNLALRPTPPSSPVARRARGPPSFFSSE